jgi:hypothetical protein
MLSEDLLKITYKGQEYTLKQLIEDNNDFMKSLAIPESLNLPPADLKFTSLGDFGYLIARDKFRHLYGLLATARYAASEAHKKLHKGPVLWSSGYTGQMWIRSQFLKNAILWYNSCDDYLLQIIWFAFDFVDPNKLTSPNIYKRALRGCRWESLFAKLEHRSAEIYIALLIKEINVLREDKDVKAVRAIANSLKHHADIYIKDLDLQPNYILSSDQGFNSSAVSDKPLDLDDTAILLQRVHLKTTKFATFLLHFIDFDAPFLDDEADVIQLDKLRVKSVYKKFSICS